MMPLVFASLTLVLGLSQTAPVSKPDFSGSWTLDRSRSQSSESITLTIKQNTAEISIETQIDGKTSTRTYPFEVSKHPASETISTGHTHASWDGNLLVTEAVGEVKGQTVSYRQLRFLNAASTEMTVETLTIVQHGYSIKDAKNYSSAKDVYVRAK
jgi:hypothetical protein